MEKRISPKSTGEIYASTLSKGGFGRPRIHVLCLRRSDFLTVKTKIKNLASN